MMMLKIISLSFILLTIILLGLFVYWSTQDSRSLGHYKKQNILVHPYAIARKHLIPGTKIKVLSWNIAFAHGQGSDGTDYSQKSKKEYLDNIKTMSTLLIQEEIDIALLQETDTNSSRSYYIHQPKVLSQQTKTANIANLTSWTLKYLPFPVNEPFGEIESGGAILSRYHLENHEQFLLSRGSMRTALYNDFYPARYIQSVEIDQQVFINLHFDAYDKENRLEQANKLLAVIQDKNPILFGGDFNTIPMDETEQDKLVFGTDDYRGDKCFSRINEQLPSRYREALSEDFNLLNTFPAHKPDRRLDYIFYDNNKLELVGTKVLTRFSDVSDHLPIVAEFIIR